MNKTMITMKMACVPGIPNVNNIVYSKECFLEAFDNYIKNKGPIPVTINPDYSSPMAIQYVDVSKIIGEVRSLNSFSSDFETITFHKNPYNKLGDNISELIDSVRVELGLRYMAKPQPSILGHTNVTDMRIIAFDVLAKNTYEDIK